MKFYARKVSDSENFIHVHKCVERFEIVFWIHRYYAKIIDIMGKAHREKFDYHYDDLHESRYWCNYKVSRVLWQ